MHCFYTICEAKPVYIHTRTLSTLLTGKKSCWGPGNSSSLVPQSLYRQLRHPRHIKEPPRVVAAWLVGGTAQPGNSWGGCGCTYAISGSTIPSPSYPQRPFPNFRSSASTHTLWRRYFLCSTGPWRFPGLGCNLCPHCVLLPPALSPFHSFPQPKCLHHLMFVFFFFFF